MKTTKAIINDRTKHIYSLILILAVVFISPLSVMFFTLFFDYTNYSDITKIVATSAVTLCLIAIPSYFICRFNYKGVWYVPVIANLGTFLIIWGIVSNYWTHTAKIVLVLAVPGLTILLSILGSIRGKQIRSKDIG